MVTHLTGIQLLSPTSNTIVPYRTYEITDVRGTTPVGRRSIPRRAFTLRRFAADEAAGENDCEAVISQPSQEVAPRLFGIVHLLGIGFVFNGNRHQEGSTGSPTEAGVPIVTLINFRFGSRTTFLNGKREHSSWGARKMRERLTRRFSRIPAPSPPEAPSMRRSIATDLWSSAVACVGVHEARLYLWASGPMSLVYGSILNS